MINKQNGWWGGGGGFETKPGKQGNMDKLTKKVTKLMISQE
jgi:hypothetical protein